MEECPVPEYDSADTFGVGYCLPEKDIPDSAKASLKLIKDSFLTGGSGQFVIDISKAWKSVCACSFLSFIICIAYVKLMSAVAEPVAWFCVFLI